MAKKQVVKNEAASFTEKNLSSGHATTAKRDAFHLVWYPPFPNKSKPPYVVGKTRDKNLWYLSKGTKQGDPNTLSEGHNVDYLRTYIEMSYYRELILPLNITPIFTQEYSTQLTNKITQYSTLGGNTLISFGAMPKKISLRVSVVKAGRHWVPFTSMLEAMTQLSGNPTKYSGSLVLYGYDAVVPSKARKYKVMVESLSPSIKATENIISYDVTMLVSVDYSSDTPSDWGRLNSVKKG